MFTHKKRFSILLLHCFIISGLIFLIGCNNQNLNENFIVFAEHANDINDYELAQKQIMDEMANTIETMFSMGARIKALSDIPGIDDIVILVEGISITRREIETQSILDNSYGAVLLKETVDDIIREKAVQAEAVLLGIEPSQDNINSYLEQIRLGFENDVTGNELLLSYLEGMEMTVEEYLETMDKVAYVMFQGGALRASIESLQTYKTYEEYANDLMSKAKVEIFDPEIKSLFE